MVQTVVSDIREDEGGIQTAGLQTGALLGILKTLTGTVDATKGSATVTGTSTLFLTELAVGSYITIGTDGVSYKVTAIASATSLTISPVYAGATVSGKKLRRGRVDATNSFSRLGDVESAYASGSKLATGAKGAFNSGLRPVIFMGLPVKFDATETVTAASGTLVNIPIHEIASAVVGGVTPLTVIGTVDDPTSKAPSATQIYVNTKTGKYKTGATVDGVSNQLVLTLTNYDLSAACKLLALELPEYVTLAGISFDPIYHGFWDELFTLGAETDKNWLFAVGPTIGSDRTEAEFKKFLETYRDSGYGKRVSGLAIKGGDGDVGASYMGLRASTPTNGKDKLQKPPGGITITDWYTLSEYGNQESPAAGTWHELGMNVVTKYAGANRITNSRAMVADGEFNQFNFRYRLTREADVKLSDALTNAMAGAPDAAPYTPAGLAVLEGALRAAAGDLVRRGKYDSFIINMPDIDELTDDNKRNAIVDLIEIFGVQAGQIMLVKQTLNVKA